MMERLTARGERIAAERAGTATDRVAAAMREAAPDAAVAREDGRVAVAARGMVRRRLADPALRWIGGLVQ